MTAATAVGTWDLVISTPLGKQRVVLELTDVGGVLHGVVRGDAEEVPLVAPTLQGDELMWTQSITKPMRLDLAFAVTIHGDALAGTSKAGRLPRSKVAGTRRPT